MSKRLILLSLCSHNAYYASSLTSTLLCVQMWLWKPLVFLVHQRELSEGARRL